MTRYIVKFFLALGLAVLIYSIGVPGCAPTHFSSLDNLSCEEFSNIFKTNDCGIDYEWKTDHDGDGGYDDDDHDHDDYDNDPDDDDEPRDRREGEDYEPPPKTPPKDVIKFNYDISPGKVDIIFVIDNSSSMAVEHRSLAEQFRSFLNKLKNVDYHIAVITTDISSSPNNPVRGKIYQDGKFIPIGRRVYLRNENMGRNPPKDVVKEFQRAIVRPETEECDPPPNQRGRSSGEDPYAEFYQGTEFGVPSRKCPSSDERGTYALNKAIENPRHRSFFRTEAHLMVVILSDEDIRSSREEYVNQMGFENAYLYEFEALDEPKTLIENIHNRFSLKSVSFYPIIIIPGDSACYNKQLCGKYVPGDDVCRDDQGRQRSGGPGTGRGYYGKEYKRLAVATETALTKYKNLLEGQMISICDRGYGSQLSKVAFKANTIRIPVPCVEPISVDLSIDGRRIRPDYRIEERTLIIEPGEVSLDAKLNVTVRCEQD